MPISKQRNFFQYPGIATKSTNELTDFRFPAAMPGSELALFVSIPYCRVRCHECPFFSSYLPPRGRRLEEFGAYYHAVSRQIDETVAAGAFSGQRVSVYVGGGTPTATGHELLGALVGKLRSVIPDIVELTVEGNPEDISDDLLDALADSGATRISLGVQASDSTSLTTIGSPHTADQAQRAISLIASRGGFDFNIDLLYGLPGQSRDLLDHEIERALALPVSSLTWYAYTVQPVGILSPSKRALRRPTTATISEASKREAYLAIRRAMFEAGRVEAMSGAFFRPGHLLRYSDVAYRQAGPLVGVGSRAYSFNGNRLVQAARQPSEYVADVTSGSLPYARFASKPLSAPELLTRRTIFELMFGHLAAETVSQWSNGPLGPAFTDLFNGWSDANCLAPSAGRFELTDLGLARGDDLLNAVWDLCDRSI